MKYQYYDFTKHFNYIRKELGGNIYYDDVSYGLNGILYLRYNKVNNYAQILKLQNGKFNVIYCFNDIGVIYSRTFNSFEKCIKFLKDWGFNKILSTHAKLRNVRLPKKLEVE